MQLGADLAVCLALTLAHSTVLLCQFMVFSVACNSKRSHAIIALLIASNFVEIKGERHDTPQATRSLHLARPGRNPLVSQCAHVHMCMARVHGACAWRVCMARMQPDCDHCPQQALLDVANSTSDCMAADGLKCCPVPLSLVSRHHLQALRPGEAVLCWSART